MIAAQIIQTAIINYTQLINPVHAICFRGLRGDKKRNIFFLKGCQQQGKFMANNVSILCHKDTGMLLEVSLSAFP